VIPERPAGDESATILLSAECRALRRTLRPLVWVILEEVALGAVLEDGRLLSRTSARQVAEHLAVDPGTAATALRALRERGLVALQRETGPGGRFGLSVYDLAPVAGLSVVRPCTAQPLVASPRVGVTSVVSSAPDGRPERPAAGTAGAGSAASPSAAAPAPDRRPGHGATSSARPPQSPRQTTFDLGPAAP
jgi:DNA-binding transcriptional ArsR family regulator